MESSFIHNRIGVNYTRAAGLSPKEAFSLFVSLGFEATFTGYLGTTALNEPYAEEAAKAGIFYESIHAPFGHINDIWSDNEAGDRMEAELRNCIETASALSVPIVVTHLSSGEHCPCINDTGHARFDRLVNAAVRNNITLAFENQRKIANLAFVMELYADVPNVGFCWDVGHEACFTDGREFMPLFGDKLVYTHIHDNSGIHNEDLHMIPFDGTIDYTRTAEHLKAFRGTLTLEFMPQNSDRYQNITARDCYERAAGSAMRLRELVEKARNQ